MGFVLRGQLKSGGESLLSGGATGNHNSGGDDDDTVAESACFSPGGTRHRRFSLPALTFQVLSGFPYPVYFLSA